MLRIAAISHNPDHTQQTFQYVLEPSIQSYLISR